MKITKKALERRLDRTHYRARYFLITGTLLHFAHGAIENLKSVEALLPEKPGKNFKGHVTVYEYRKGELWTVRVGMDESVEIRPISLAELRRSYKQGTPCNKRKEWWSWNNQTSHKLPVSKYRW
jgi:hypothetical protein